MPRWLPALAVFLAAAAIRLWQCDLTPFLDDEASLLARGVELLDTGRIPLVGGAFSIGVREPPLMTFLLAPLLAISHSPAWITACFCLLDAAAALLVYLTGRRLAGAFGGLAAGLLYAIAPAAIVFTRHTDYYGPIPFFVALAMFCLVHAWQESRGLTLAVALVATAFALQLHPISGMLLPVWIAAAALLAKRLDSWKPFAPAVAAIGLSLAPYLYLQARDGWSDLAGLGRFLTAPKITDWAAPAQALTLAGGGTFQQQLLPRGTPPPLLSLDVAGCLFVALAAAGIVCAARRSRGGWWIVLALALLPVAASIRHTAGVLPYYLLPIVPPAAVLMSEGLAAIPLRPAAGAVLAAALIWQGAAYVHFQQTVAESGPALAYGMPLRYEAGAAGLLREPPGSRVFVGQEGNQSASFPYLTGFRYQVSHTDSRYGLAFGTAAASYVVQADGPPFDFLASHFGPPTAVVRTPAGKPVFGLFHVPSNALDRAGLAPTPAQAGPIQVRGWSAPSIAAGQPSPVMVEWATPPATPNLPAEVQQFAHLVDGQGSTWSTDADERAYPRREWRAGDAVLTWFDLAPRPSAPTGGYWLDTGFYGYTSGEPVASVRLGALRVAGVSPPAGPVQAVFGDGELALAGVARSGLDVTLTWQALSAPRGDYTVFVHLLDGSGRLIAQHDGPPQDGAFPTSLWQPGDTAADIHHLAGETAGAESIEVGLYRRPSLERLAAVDPSGKPLGDHLSLPA
jgi:4-amino-4-deoxy-L-arabinose transferase-like glycosyltransferase